MKDSIVLTEYSAEWPNHYSAAARDLLDTFPDEILGIEHVGSTAVPGIRAKPIIDLMVGVSSMEIADELIPKLLQMGWDTSATFNQSLVDRRFLLRWPNGIRTHHLHLVIFRGQDWTNKLAFRDLLRANTTIRAQYEKLKADLARKFANDREAYTDGKSDFISSALKTYCRNCKGPESDIT